MAYDSDGKLAGPIVFDQSVIERDAMIREDNDGEPIDDNAVREYVKENRDKIFSLQNGFFSELRHRLGKNTRA
jgi:hypothetical protein